MRITLSEVFDVSVVDDAIHVTAKQPCALNPYWEIKLQAEIDRSRDAEKLRHRSIEVYEDSEGRLHVDGFAAAEAR